MRTVGRFRSYLTPGRVAFGAVALVAILAMLAAWRLLGANVSATAIRGALASFGVLAPLALIASLAAVLVVPVLPASLLQIGAGLAFGPWLGLLYATLADVLGASAGYWLGHHGRSFLEDRLSASSHARLVALTRRMSWSTVVLLRLIPGPTYPLVSLAAGHARLGYLRFITASLAGVLPALILLVLAGDLVESSPWLALVIVALVVGSLALAGRLLGRAAPEESEFPPA